MAGTTPTSTPTNLHGDPSCMQWQSEYGVKMLRLRSWAGRYTADQLVGHKWVNDAQKLHDAAPYVLAAFCQRFAQSLAM